MSVTLESTTESVILAAIRSGDVHRAIELLLETFQDEVFGYCTRLVGHPAASRVYERVLTAAITDIQGGELDTSLRGWIYAIARKAVTHHHQLSHRSFPEALQSDYVPVEGPGDPGVDDPPLEIAMADLDPAIREVLQLIYWHGLTPTEAAFVIGRRVSEVHEMVAAGLSHTALCLQRCGGAPS